MRDVTISSLPHEETELMGNGVFNLTLYVFFFLPGECITVNHSFTTSNLFVCTFFILETCFPIDILKPDLLHATVRPLVSLLCFCSSCHLPFTSLPLSSCLCCLWVCAVLTSRPFRRWRRRKATSQKNSVWKR